MTVLVTGGAGYIGSHVVHALCDRGEDVIVLDDLSTGRTASLPPAARFFQGSTGDQRLTSSLMRQCKVRSIMHFAASIVVPDSVVDPIGYYRNNTLNTGLLVETAIRSGVRNFIFSSTAAVYGQPEVALVGEDAATRPISPYGNSKLASEMMLGDAGRAYGLRHVILRYFNVAGADPRLRTGQSSPAATHLIKVAAQAALGRRDGLKVFGTDYPTADGTCVRDYIHVSDLAAAHAAALDYLRDGGADALFNCGYGRGFSVREVIEEVKRISGRDFAVELAGRRAGDPPCLVADVRRIRSELGWKPQHDDLNQIVTHALAWERKLSEPAGRLASGVARGRYARLG